MPADLPPLLVDRYDAARLLAICPRTIDAMIRDGRLPAVHFGRAVRIKLSELHAFIDGPKCAGNCATVPDENSQEKLRLLASNAETEGTSR